jgi:hypothetical protein
MKIDSENQLMLEAAPLNICEVIKSINYLKA